MNTFKKVVLFTGDDGRAAFREEQVELNEGTPEMQLTPVLPTSGYRFRRSPIGFDYDFHVSEPPCWVVVLEGAIEIILRDGSGRVFRAGECFYAGDTLPPNATFDEAIHGHRSRQVGPEPLVTVLVRG